MVGGLKGGTATRVFNWQSQTWTDKASNNQARFTPACGIFVHPDGTKDVVVAGGRNANNFQ